MYSHFFLILICFLLTGSLNPATCHYPICPSVLAAKVAASNRGLDGFASDNKWNADRFNYEIDFLRRSYAGPVVSLSDPNVAAAAPSIRQFLTDMLKQITDLTGILTPEIKLYLAYDAYQYNASASVKIECVSSYSEYVHRARDDGSYDLVSESIVTESVKTSALLIGVETIRLFSWRKDFIPLLFAILLHEAGHIFYGHTVSTPENEHAADAFAAGFLADATILVRGIEMISFASHLFVALCSVISDVRIKFDLVKMVLPRIAAEFPTFGELSSGKSHSYMSVAVFNAITKGLQFPPGLRPFQDVVDATYVALRKSCTDQRHVFDTLSRCCLEHMCTHLDAEKYSRPDCQRTHPIPSERNCFIGRLQLQHRGLQ